MNTDEEWEAWGRMDPYYAVLSADQYRGRPAGEARAEFFASGERHIAHVLRIIREHLDPAFAPRSALDFGCGVGRTAIPLGRLCETTGVDVAPSMLAEAQRNAQAAGVVLHLQGSSTGKFDLVHSTIVFQHIPVRRGLALAEGLLSQVNPGGVAVLHFTYRNTRSFLVRAINWLRYRVPALHFATNLARGRPLLEPPTQMNSYPLEQLLPLFAGKRLFFETTDHGGYLGLVAYIQF